MQKYCQRQVLYVLHEFDIGFVNSKKRFALIFMLQYADIY